MEVISFGEMIMAKSEIKISVEKVVHKSLKDFLEEVCKQHDIRIENISVSWITDEITGIKISSTMSADFTL